MKTREEVEKLKREWLYDPCWDIEEAVGFEEYRYELKEFREKIEARWEIEKLQNKNKELIELIDTISELSNPVYLAKELLNIKKQINL